MATNTKESMEYGKQMIGYGMYHTDCRTLHAYPLHKMAPK